MLQEANQGLHLCLPPSYHGPADYSSAFNTIVPTRQARQLNELNTPLCAWILDFWAIRPWVVRVAETYSLHTHDCVARVSSNCIIKFVDDTGGGQDL